MFVFENLDARSIRFTWFYSISQIKLKYRYTFLGFLWNFLEPALYLIILSLVFSVINKMDIRDYAVFLFSALVPWRYFEKVVNTMTDSIVQGEWLHKKMYVSQFAFPLNRWLTASFEFLFSIIVAFLIFAFLKTEWTIHLIILPLAIIPWAIFGMGLGMIFAVLFTFFRDIKPFIQLALTLAFFTSPILFKQEVFESGSIQAQIMALHPFTYLAALFQKPVYNAMWPTSADWVVSFSFAMLSLIIGVYLVKVNKSKFYFYL